MNIHQALTTIQAQLCWATTDCMDNRVLNPRLPRGQLQNYHFFTWKIIIYSVILRFDVWLVQLIFKRGQYEFSDLVVCWAIHVLLVFTCICVWNIMLFLWNYKLMILVSSYLLFRFVSLALCHIIIWTNYISVFCNSINLIALKILVRNPIFQCVHLCKIFHVEFQRVLWKMCIYTKV